MAGPIVTAAGLWRETREVVARHRGALMTLAAATVFLPNAALRLLTPGVAAQSLEPGQPPQLSPVFWAVLLSVVLLQFAGLFAIAAITADPREGGGRTLGETLTAALPALGRFLLALVLFTGVYLLASIGLGLILAIVLAIASVASPDILTAAAKGQPPVGLMVLILAAFVPLMLWLWARLSPLPGVYLREPLGVTAGIRRAWAMSKPATGAAVMMIGAYTLASIATGAMQASSGNDGIVGILINLLFAALGAVVFVYGAAATGIVYRLLAERR